MTVAATLTSVQYTGNGSATQFSFNNKVFQASDLVVTLFDLSGNQYTFLNQANTALGISYAVQNVDVDTGCLVVFNTPPALNWTIDIRTDTPELQSTSIKNQGAFLPELHEEAFDRLTRIVQDDFRQTYTFGIHGPDTEATPWPAMPGIVARKGLIVMFDPLTGLPTAGQPTTQNITQGLILSLLNANAIGSLLYAPTQAENAVPVTVVNAAYPPLTLERYGGGVTASTAANDTALSAAFAVAALQSGSTVYAQAIGAYSFSANQSFPKYTTLQGGGYGTIFSYTGSGNFLTIASGNGRSKIQDLQLVGTNRTGVGLTLGDASGNASWCDLTRVLFTAWATGMRIGGATWLRCVKCEFGNAAGAPSVHTNTIGIDFNFFGGNNYSSAMTFVDCVISNNGQWGVFATNTPINMNQIVWTNCTCQNNCFENLANGAQFYMGNVVNFTIDNMYFEYLGGTPPDALRIDNAGLGEIRSVYCNTAKNAIVDRGGGSCSQIQIVDLFAFGLTANAISMASETDVVAYGCNIGAAPVTLTGTGCSFLPTGSGLASWPNAHNSWPVAPQLAGSGGGSPTGTFKGDYSKVGNLVTACFEIVTTGLGGLTGNVSVNNFPLAPENNLTLNVLVALEVIGITPAGSNNQFYGKIAGGATSMLLMGGGTTTPVQVVATALAAATTIRGIVTYQAA